VQLQCCGGVGNSAAFIVVGFSQIAIDKIQAKVTLQPYISVPANANLGQPEV